MRIMDIFATRILQNQQSAAVLTVTTNHKHALWMTKALLCMLLSTANSASLT